MSSSLAFVFPGQGSQAVGMLAELGAQHAVIRETFAEASAALGYDLWALTQEGPAELLNHYAQQGSLASDYYGGHWSDAGTHESLLHAARLSADQA